MLAVRASSSHYLGSAEDFGFGSKTQAAARHGDVCFTPIIRRYERLTHVAFGQKQTQATAPLVAQYQGGHFCPEENWSGSQLCSRFLTMKHEPDEEQHIGENYGRGHPCDWLADIRPSPREDEAKGNCHHNSCNNSDQDLRHCVTTAIELRMQTIVCAKQEQGDPSQKVKVGVSRHCRVIFRDAHVQAP